MDRSEQYEKAETQKRLRKILHGAFAGPPTPLKDIPKKNGESRAAGKAKKKSRRSGIK